MTQPGTPAPTVSTDDEDDTDQPRTGLPSRITDERALAVRGFVTSASELDTRLLEAAFVNAACTEGAEVAELFLLAGYSPDSENSEGVRPLHCAARRGEVQLVRRLLDLGAEPETYTHRKKLAPIHYAAMAQQIEIMRLLVNKGASINSASGYGTPLLIAIRSIPPPSNGSLDTHAPAPAIYEELTALGASVSAADEHNDTLLIDNAPSWPHRKLYRTCSFHTPPGSGESWYTEPMPNCPS